MRSRLDALITQHVLEQMESWRGTNTIDVYEALNGSQTAEIKNVCAKVHVSLSDRIDECVRTLGIQKRVFLEAAFLDALNRYEQIATEEGLFDGQHWEQVPAQDEAA